jgi:lipopolysaccharide transport system permease protein
MENKTILTKVISAEQDSFMSYIKKVWEYRPLILTLAKRDLKVKYAQTYLGLAWTIIQPITAVVVFSLFFSVLLEIRSGYPYVLFVLSGVLIWNLFNYIFSQGSSSLINNQDLIRKLYFPKIVLPLSKILVALVEFGITLILFIALLIFFRVDVKWFILFSPLIIINVILFSIGITLILCAATIKNRDLNHILPFIINFGVWFTPVFYPVTLVPQKWSIFLFLNPMASCIQQFRYVLLPEAFNPMSFLGVPVCLIIFIVGFLYFKKMEDTIIDNI